MITRSEGRPVKGVFAAAVLAELDKVARPLDDDELASRLGVVRQVVNATCRRLATQGRIDRWAPPHGKILNRSIDGTRRHQVDHSPVLAAEPGGIGSGNAFETNARGIIETAWGMTLDRRTIELPSGVQHSFDFVSTDGRVIGDAKWYKDLRSPAAKLSTISEYVWLLQHVDSASRRFLVFGQDRAVPERWLARFRPLLGGVEIWFLGDEELHRLA